MAATIPAITYSSNTMEPADSNYVGIVEIAARQERASTGKEPRGEVGGLY